MGAASSNTADRPTTPVIAARTRQTAVARQGGSGGGGGFGFFVTAGAASVAAGAGVVMVNVLELCGSRDAARFKCRSGNENKKKHTRHLRQSLLTSSGHNSRARSDRKVSPTRTKISTSRATRRRTRERIELQGALSSRPSSIKQQRD